MPKHGPRNDRRGEYWHGRRHHGRGKRPAGARKTPRTSYETDPGEDCGCSVAHILAGFGLEPDGIPHGWPDKP